MITKALVEQYAKSCDLNRVCGPLGTLLDDEWESLHRFAALAAAHGAAQRDAELMGVGMEPVQIWCDTCEGSGQVYQEHQAGCHVGGHYQCPDCDGMGFIKRSDASLAAARLQGAKQGEPEPIADLSMMVRRLVLSIRRLAEDDTKDLTFANACLDWLKHKGLAGSPLRDGDLPAPETKQGEHEAVVIVKGWRDGELKAYATKMGVTFDPDTPLYTATQLAAARLQGADEMKQLLAEYRETVDSAVERGNQIVLLNARITDLERVNQGLLEALTSIAKNSCCDSCQEAARVARAAIAAAAQEVGK